MTGRRKQSDYQFEDDIMMLMMRSLLHIVGDEIGEKVEIGDESTTVAERPFQLSAKARVQLEVSNL